MYWFVFCGMVGTKGSGPPLFASFWWDYEIWICISNGSRGTWTWNPLVVNSTDCQGGGLLTIGCSTPQLTIVWYHSANIWVLLRVHHWARWGYCSRISRYRFQCTLTWWHYRKRWLERRTMVILTAWMSFQCLEGLINFLNRNDFVQQLMSMFSCSLAKWDGE